MRKVIFVGGTSYSGSTAFHLMLANDPAGFACGELDTLFHPLRDGHVRRLADLESDTLELWQKAYIAGPDQVYQRLFDLMPDRRFIVDSSKNAHWFHRQAGILAKQGIEAHQLVIWKTPLEFAQSRKKRKMLTGWQKEWRNSHRVYFTLLARWWAVQYSQLATAPEQVLPAVCAKVGIPYFDGKADFWQQEAHHLGGNYSARVHLHQGEKAAQFSSTWIQEDRMQNHQQVYYKPVEDTALQQEVDQTLAADPTFGLIRRTLEQNDAVNARQFVPPPGRIRVSAAEIAVRSLRDGYRIRRGKRQYAGAVAQALAQPYEERTIV